MKTAIVAVVLLTALSSCSEHSGTVPGNTEDTQPFAEIGEDAEIQFSGTEPFWGGSVAGQTLTWTTPANIEGVDIAVTRFAGRGGLSFSGMLSGRSFDLAITPGECSDGMSDRVYPFVATVSLGGDILAGCAWRAGEDLDTP